MTPENRETPLSPLLSYLQAAPLLEARQEGRETTEVSLDLGLTLRPARLTSRGAAVADGPFLTWETIRLIHEETNVCFLLEEDTARPLRRFSEASGYTYSLMPTTGAPALLIAGFTMHRFKGITPQEAAAAMVAAVGPLRGLVLDTTTGLGYTAVAAARLAPRVVTIERDPLVAEMARLNPWSRELFTRPVIERIMGASEEEIGKFPDGAFSAVIHDPPSMSLAGELYSGTFYRQVFRVLAPRGRFFHYIGDPASTMGARVTKGVVQRLREAGFRQVTPQPRAYGVTAAR